ncbi:MAG: hypothetical protein ABI807_08585 [Sporichthyaceae bacterium]
MSADSADPGPVALLDAHVLPAVTVVGFAFHSAGRTTDGGRNVDAVLYEAGPEPFTSSFPELASDYGDQRVPCIDLWVHHDLVTGTRRADLEGTDVARWAREHAEPDLAGAITGPDLADAVRALAEALARMLPPRPRS